MWYNVNVVDAGITLSGFDTWLWHEQTGCSCVRSPSVPRFVVCEVGISQHWPYRIVGMITCKTHGAVLST